MFRQKRPQEECVPVPLTLEDVLQTLTISQELHKVKALNKHHKCKIKIDLQDLCIQYHGPQYCLPSRINFISIDNIEEVRAGWQTDVFHKIKGRTRARLRRLVTRKDNTRILEGNSFSIIISPSHKTVDFAANSSVVRDAWVQGLGHLVAMRQNVQRESEHKLWLKKMFEQADASNSGSLTFQECLNLLNQLNIEMDPKHAQSLFDAANFRNRTVDDKPVLDPDEFLKFYQSLLDRPPLEALFRRFSSKECPIMDPQLLRRFLKQEQKVEASVDDCKAMIKKYEPDEHKLPGYLSIKGFMKILLSPDHEIFKREHQETHQNMTYPITDYFIASSHNTYLLQDQLLGESSVEGYIRSLQQGCRCVELDIWDGPNDEPVIYHGMTLTSKILFYDVLESIRLYAFKASKYPVILSLENHCSIQQQIKMACYFKQVLGEYIYTLPANTDAKQFPSPEELMYKILIKGKKVVSGSKVESAPVNSNDVAEPSQAKPVQIAKELSDLVFFESRSFHCTLEEAAENWHFSHMASFSEGKAKDLSEEESFTFATYNKRHMSRIYPKGSRIDSSNYEPFIYWTVGCQMVALNYQAFDPPWYRNHCWFAENGRCGYVLKPEFLRTDATDDSVITGELVVRKTVEIRVISGQHLPKPGNAVKGEVVDPYVIIEVYGHPADIQNFKTEFVTNNGFNPEWDETFSIPLHFPELAFILFVVRDECKIGKNAMLGWYGLPFTCLAQGYRHIHLEDDYGQRMTPASLFVHIAIQEGESA